jgi:hypothetical protein
MLGKQRCRIILLQAQNDLSKNSMIATKSHIRPDCRMRKERIEPGTRIVRCRYATQPVSGGFINSNAGANTWKVLRLFDFLGVGEYNVTRKSPLYWDSFTLEIQKSGLSRYFKSPWPSGRGTRESIVYISLEQPLKDPPLVRTALVLRDSDLIRCESK